MSVLATPFSIFRTSAIIAASLLLLGGCDVTAAFRATRTAQVAHVAGSPVSIITENGSVDLARADISDVQITAHLRAQTQERLDATSIAVVRDAAGLLTISVDWPGGLRRGDEGCDFEVRLPDASGITIDSSNGRLSLAGLSGPAVLGTSNGRIEVAGHDGEVRAHTSNGHITLRDVKGDVMARSTNGAIDLLGIAGKAETSTSNGHIEIRLDAASPGPVFAETSNGSISVDLGPTFSGKVSMRTSNGEIRVSGAEASGGKHSKSVVVGSGGVESILKTSNGRIQLKVSR
ncbi:MAG: hypothetical protein IT436_03635 [Phycisphaerales bacterium]|nr:hypothetical protein [Phycisphaerales bacterium]